MQTQVQTAASTTVGITREMLMLVLYAAATGTAAAVLAGFLVVALTVIAT